MFLFLGQSDSVLSISAATDVFFLIEVCIMTIITCTCTGILRLHELHCIIVFVATHI